MAQLKCHQCMLHGEELEATMLLVSSDLIVTIDTWRDESYDWTIAIKGYRLFKRHR